MKTKKININLDESEIEITADNFDEYFFDIRKHNPKKGQVIACYSAIAYFEASNEKLQMIQLLRETEKAEAAGQVMRKLLHASEPDCWRIPKEIASDLLSGMSEDEVNNKSYKYKLEMYYYTDPKCIPEDPHWSTISILNIDSVEENVNEEALLKKD